MSTDTRKNFLGIPVEGDIQRGSSRVPQRPLSELEPLLRRVIEDPFIDSIGWKQYTPYFNDGEPCEFSVGHPWFRTTSDVASRSTDDEDEDYDGDDYRFELDGEHPSLGRREYDWRRKVELPYEGEHEALYDACSKLSKAVNGGEFEDVLLEAFGDHAQVTVRASGITVDSYSHD